MSNDLSKLSKDELIALVLQSQQKAEAAERKVVIAERKVVIAEQKAQVVQNLREKAELRADAFQKMYGAAAVFAEEIAPLVRDMRLQTEKLLTDDPIAAQKLWEDLGKCVRKIVAQAQNAGKYKELAFGKGGESTVPSKAQLLNDQQSILQDMVSIEKGIREAEKAQKKIKDLQEDQEYAVHAADSEVNSEIHPMHAHMRTIADARRPKALGDEAEQTKTSKRRGRQKNKSDLPKASLSASGVPLKKCPDCEGELKLFTEKQIEELAAKVVNLRDRYQKIRHEIGFCYCSKCGQIHPVFPEGMQCPVSPGRTISMNCLSEVVTLIDCGIPLSRIETMMLSRLKLGSNTLLTNLRDFAEIYLNLLMKWIVTQCEDAVFLADETRFDALEGQGRGAYAGKQKTSSQTYLFSLGTKETSSTPFISFSALGSRRAEDIGSILAPLKEKMEFLVVDGYGGYEALDETVLEGVSRQNCIVHARRGFYEAATNKTTLAELGKLTTEERRQFWAEQVRKGTPQSCVLAILRGFQLLYLYEDEVRERLEGESDKAHAERILAHRKKHSAPIVEAIVSLISEIAKTTTKEKNGKYTKCANTPIAKAVAYWMNRKESLIRFLEDGRVPLDTNTVERAIRPAAVLRKNVVHVQSMAGLSTLATCLSVAETAKLNGIDCEAWLNSFSTAAFQHAYAKHWRQAYATGKDLSKKIQQWDMESLLKDFDLTPYLPWNWKKQQLPTS